jgi:two-component system, sensor histidine kinase SagS
MKMEFLVVEDDPVMQILTPRMLQTLGYTARVTTNGEDAIRACREIPPDAVLMDVQMPRMNGLEATRELRRLQRHEGLPPFPIIVLSAFHTPAERAACFDAGADGFITKPLMIAKLATEIHRVITLQKQPEMQRTLL